MHYDGIEYKPVPENNSEYRGVCAGCAFDHSRAGCVDVRKVDNICSENRIIWVKVGEVTEPQILATDKQEGGSHYKTAIQPVDYIHANSLDFFEGNVVKYVTRHKKKNGAEDIRKAIHYLEMILQFQYPKETK